MINRLRTASFHVAKLPNLICVNYAATLQKLKSMLYPISNRVHFTVKTVVVYFEVGWAFVPDTRWSRVVVLH